MMIGDILDGGVEIIDMESKIQALQQCGFHGFSQQNIL